jgi:hypothetical protein
MVLLYSPLLQVCRQVRREFKPILPKASGISHREIQRRGVIVVVVNLNFDHIRSHFYLLKNFDKSFLENDLPIKLTVCLHFTGDETALKKASLDGWLDLLGRVHLHSGEVEYCVAPATQFVRETSWGLMEWFALLNYIDVHKMLIEKGCARGEGYSNREQASRELKKIKQAIGGQIAKLD